MSRSTRELQIDAYINQARLHASRGEQEKALYYWGLVIQVDPNNPQARAYFQQLGTSSHLDTLKNPPPNERWNASNSPPWREGEPPRRPPLDYRGGAPRSPYPHPRTPPPVLPLEEARLKGLHEVEASWQASELELPMEYDEAQDNPADFLSPYSHPAPISRSAAEWLATVSASDEEEGQTVIAPARSALNEALRATFDPPTEMTLPYPDLPPAFSEVDEQPRPVTSKPPTPTLTERPPTQPPPSQKPSNPPPSRVPTQPPPSRRPTQPPISTKTPEPSEETRSSVSLPRATRTTPQQGPDEMLARALAMALSKDGPAPTKPKTQPPQTHHPKETRSSAHWSRAQSPTGRRAKTTPAPTETPSQQRLSSAAHTQSSSLMRASRSQHRLVAASETRNKLSEENQKKMEALVRALDAALQKDSSKPPQLSPPSSSSQEAAFEAEALTGKFPILAIDPPDQHTATEELPPSPMAPRPETKTADPPAKEQRFFPEDNNSTNISGQAINQAAERLTAELRASLAFFSSDELQKGQEDPESMLNEILDIIAGQEQANFSQETLTAILDQTLQNLQGPQYDYSSISENFTPAGLEAMSSSQVQLNAVPASSFPPPSTEDPPPFKDNATASPKQKTSPPTSQDDNATQAFEELFGQAMTTYLRRQYKQALALFEECLQLRPDDPRTLYNIERLRKRIN